MWLHVPSTSEYAICCTGCVAKCIRSPRSLSKRKAGLMWTRWTRFTPALHLFIKRSWTRIDICIRVLNSFNSIKWFITIANSYNFYHFYSQGIICVQSFMKLWVVFHCLCSFVSTTIFKFKSGRTVPPKYWFVWVLNTVKSLSLCFITSNSNCLMRLVI